MNLKGKSALVTGGAVRIGRALCERLAEQGVNVVVHYKDSAREAEDLCAELKGTGVGAWCIRADLAIEEECMALVAGACECAGKLDILINNAAVFQPDSLRTFSGAAAASQFRLNLLAPQALMSVFGEQAHGGCIVNMLDSRIRGCDTEHLSYVLSKKALADLTVMAARAYAPVIRVNAVAPGDVLAPTGQTGEKAEPVLLERQGSVNEVVDAVLFLLRNEAVTGQIIFVDGGQHLLRPEFET